MILVNGAVSDTVAATDRGYTYGDGVFRTVSMRNRVPDHWLRQYRKLALDCSKLFIPCPPEPAFRADIAVLARDMPDGVVKIIVTRGPGPRGYALPASVNPARVLMSSPLPQYPARYTEAGVRLHVCQLKLASQPALAGIKHLNRLEQILARAEWDDPDMPEGLLLDTAGNVIGGTMTNLFIVENGSLITPSLEHCGVAGVTRDRVLELAPQRAIDCRIEPIPWSRFIAADEAVLVNSVVGLWRVMSCGKKQWEPGPVANKLIELLARDATPA
jgi:4-amino-4-deoxychorismate lyase